MTICSLLVVFQASHSFNLKCDKEVQGMDILDYVEMFSIW